MEEKRIALWNIDTLGWNTKEYIDEHSEFKTHREHQKFYIWETALYVAEELGLGIGDVEFLIKENENLEVADLFFCMFLIRIYGRGYAEQYIGKEKRMTIQNIQQLIREAAGYIIDQDSQEGEVTEVPDESVAKEVEKIFTEIAQNNSQMQKQFDSYMEQIKKGLEALAEKEKAKGEESQMQTDAKSEDEVKQMQKLEVENEVLKFQLAHKDEMAKLQLQLQLSAKEAELKQAEQKVQELQKQCEAIQKRCEEMEKKDEQRGAELQNLFSAYQVTVEANTKAMADMKPNGFWSKRKNKRE